jgi:hypothetical protein
VPVGAAGAAAVGKGCRAPGAKHPRRPSHRRGLLRRTRRGRGRRRFLHHHGTHARKIKAAQKRIRAQLARPAQIHQELHHQLAQLGELARELVRGARFLAVAFARQQIQPPIRQLVEQAIESFGQPLRLPFRVHFARRGRLHGQRHAENLPHFFLCQVADKFGEEIDPVQLGEKHINRKTDPQRLRDLAQPRLQVASEGANLLGRIRTQETLAVHHHQRRPRRLLRSPHRRQSSRPQTSQQTQPARTFRKQSPACFHEQRLARQPDIDRPRRHDSRFLIHLPGEQLRIQPRMHHRAGLGRAALPDQQHHRQVAHADRATARRPQPLLRLADQQLDFIRAGFAALRLFRTCRSTLATRHPQQRQRRQQHQKRQTAPQHPQVQRGQTQPGGHEPGQQPPDRQRPARQNVPDVAQHARTLPRPASPLLPERPRTAVT